MISSKMNRSFYIIGIAMKILVTGGAGFIGSGFSSEQGMRKLKGYKICVLDFPIQICKF